MLMLVRKEVISTVFVVTIRWEYQYVVPAGWFEHFLVESILNVSGEMFAVSKLKTVWLKPNDYWVGLDETLILGNGDEDSEFSESEWREAHRIEPHESGSQWAEKND
jgi:hypothetical protein